MYSGTIARGTLRAGSTALDMACAAKTRHGGSRLDAHHSGSTNCRCQIRYIRQTAAAVVPECRGSKEASSVPMVDVTTLLAMLSLVWLSTGRDTCRRNTRINHKVQRQSLDRPRMLSFTMSASLLKVV